MLDCVRDVAPQMYIEMKYVTPEWARDILENHNHVNRKINPKTVQKYMNDMASGNFKITHQGIAIRVNGELEDGQHRLMAICKLGIPQWMAVIYNAPHTVYCDQQRKRGEKDALNISGEAPFTLANYHLAMAMLAIMISQKRTSDNISVSEKLNWIIDNRENLKALRLDTTKAAKIGSMSSVTLAMLSAYKNGYSASDIIRWRDVLTTGLIADLKEQSAVMLRNQILAGQFNSQSDRIQLLKTCQNNLYHFLNKEDIKMVKRPNTFIWVIK